MDGAPQGCSLPGPYGGVSCGACVGFAPRALLAANSGFTYWRISFKVGKRSLGDGVHGRVLSFAFRAPSPARGRWPHNGSARSSIAAQEAREAS
jgi:hypothetical protein